MTRKNQIPVGSRVVCGYLSHFSCWFVELSWFGVSSFFFRQVLNVSCGINVLMKRWWWRFSDIYVTFIELSRFSYRTFYQTGKYLLYWRGGGTRSHQTVRYLNQLTNSRQVIPAGSCARHQSTQDFTIRVSWSWSSTCSDCSSLLQTSLLWFACVVTFLPSYQSFS